MALMAPVGREGKASGGRRAGAEAACEEPPPLRPLTLCLKRNHRRNRIAA